MALGTYDCDPTLTDSQVLDFCCNGFLMLEGVVPDEVNRRTNQYLERGAADLEPTGILEQDWFIEHVICNLRAAGVVRSLLGAGFHLPVLMSNHHREGPQPAVGAWHVDGNYRFSHELNFLQVFYYPQDTPVELGPTEVLPGSHFLRGQQRYLAHLNNIKGGQKTAAPAGSIFITVYHIWHRTSPLSCAGVRDMLKYVYWRTSPPRRDWIIEPGFDFASADYERESPSRRKTEQFRTCRDVAEMFYWLCGMHDRSQVLGGQSWPMPAKRNGAPYGFPGPDGGGEGREKREERGETGEGMRG